MENFDDLMGELGEELRGIAEYWGIDLGLLVGLNLSYELRRVIKYQPQVKFLTFNSSLDWWRSSEHDQYV